jgi:hypothetical protein
MLAKGQNITRVSGIVEEGLVDQRALGVMSLLSNHIQRDISQKPRLTLEFYCYQCKLKYGKVFSIALTLKDNRTDSIWQTLVEYDITEVINEVHPASFSNTINHVIKGSVLELLNKFQQSEAW